MSSHALVNGPAKFFSARMQPTSSQTIFSDLRSMQLASDLTNLLSDSRVTRLQMYIVMICLHETREWHEKFVLKLACHMCVNVKLKLSCTVGKARNATYK